LTLQAVEASLYCFIKSIPFIAWPIGKQLLGRFFDGTDDDVINSRLEFQPDGWEVVRHVLFQDAIFLFILPYDQGAITIPVGNVAQNASPA
jgi:hypothetical protein